MPYQDRSSSRTHSQNSNCQVPEESSSAAGDLRSVLPSLWHCPFLLLLTEAALKATSRVGTPGLIFYLTQWAPCLVYKLILCYFQVSNKNEPENSFLQDCWIFSCVIEFGFVEAEIGGREVTERHSSSPPNLYVSVSKCHYSEKILFNCNVIISYIRPSLGSGWYLL